MKDPRGPNGWLLRAPPIIFSSKLTLYYFFKIEFYFRKVVQNFELKKIGGAPKRHSFAPLKDPLVQQCVWLHSKHISRCLYSNSIWNYLYHFNHAMLQDDTCKSLEPPTGKHQTSNITTSLSHWNGKITLLNLNLLASHIYSVLLNRPANHSFVSILTVPTNISFFCLSSWLTEQSWWQKCWCYKMVESSLGIQSTMETSVPYQIIFFIAGCTIVSFLGCSNYSFTCCAL